MTVGKSRATFPPAVVEVPEEGLPTDFGKYRLEKRIATGGMAEIFLAHRHDEPLRPLVIKRILPHLSKSGEFVSMFLDEARIAAQLQHPNVVGIEDVGQIDGAYYIAMEYVHGEDIRRIYNRAYKLQRSLPLSHSIRVIADAALGLGYAHKLTDFTGRPMGVVHRDVSPQNILVTYEGEAKVVDFGIAKAQNKVAQTRAGVLKGKYSYMSPEQALGDPIDHRTDIFALGIILYETTTGTRLFKRHNELATLQAIIKCEFVPPQEALPNYPPELEAVLLRALAKHPADRYDDAEELSAALYEFLYESHLYVERDVIAEFMADLFSDRLDAEQGSGEPALPREDEVRAEMADSTTPMRSSNPSAPPPVPAPTDGAPRPGSSTRAERSDRLRVPAATSRPSQAPRLAGFEVPEEGMEASATTPEDDLEDLEAAYRAAVPQVQSVPVDARGERRRSTEIIRPGVEPPDTHLDHHPPPDMAPTVAAVPSYRPTSAPEVERPRIERGATTPVTDRGKRASGLPSRGPKKHGEPTEYVRGKGTGRGVPEETQEEWPPLEEAPARRPILVAGILLAAVLVAVLTGVVVSRVLLSRMGTDAEQARAPDSDPVSVARVTVLTEPGANVWIDGVLVGVARASGAAGPLDVEPGSVVIRVAQPALGFERERTLDVESGQNYQFEIRGRHGFLRLAVAPWARVTVDGRDHGLTPLPKITLFEGTHRVVLENPDIGRRYAAVVKISAGQESELKIDLKDAGERM